MSNARFVVANSYDNLDKPTALECDYQNVRKRASTVAFVALQARASTETLKVYGKSIQEIATHMGVGDEQGIIVESESAHESERLSGQVWVRRIA